MTNHIWEDGDGMRLEVLEPNPTDYNIFLDNVHLGNPKTHAFAGLLIKRTDAAKFVQTLAAELGLDVEVTHDSHAASAQTAVVIQDEQEADDEYGIWDPSDPRYTVTGDISAILTYDEVVEVQKRWGKLDLHNGSWTVNYFVQDLAKQTILPEHPSLDFDSEGACFFAYTDDKADAEFLAGWINTKGFLA